MAEVDCEMATFSCFCKPGSRFHKVTVEHLHSIGQLTIKERHLRFHDFIKLKKC